MYGYAQCCAFISVIELPRILAYCPKLSDKASRFAKRALADFSETMIVMLSDMPLEEISVQKICDVCNYPRSTFYNYFDDIYDLMDYCWIVIMKDMDVEKYQNVQGE